MIPLDAFDLILFGGSGDLAMRKLLPALYFRHRDTEETEGWRIMGLGREALSREEYVAKVEASCRKFVSAKDFDQAAWESFARCLDFQQVDATQSDDFTSVPPTSASSIWPLRQVCLPRSAKTSAPRVS